MKKPVAIILVVIVLLAAGIGGWLWYQSHQDRGLTLYGNVDIRTVNMSFRVGGRLASLTVDEGQALAGLAQRTMRLQCTIQEGLIWLGDDERQVELKPEVLFDEMQG